MNKEEIINLYSKNQFSDFLEQDNNGKILELFDREGIEILKQSPLKTERIKYILTFSKYKNEVLQNKDFLDIILNSNIKDYYSVLKDLEIKTYEDMIQRSIELNKSEDTISRLLTFFSTEAKLSIIENKILNKNIVIGILNKSYDPKVIQKILDTYDIDLSDQKVNVANLFEKSKKSSLKKQALNTSDYFEVTINPNYITKDLAQRLWNENNIFQLRTILNNAQYSTDITLLNNYVKNMEEQIISQSNGLMYPYNEIYNLYKKTYEDRKKTQINDYSSIYENIAKFKTLCNQVEIKNFSAKIENMCIKNGIEDALNYIEQMNNREISNYIIDYHFEENYYNIIIDINQLLQYYYDGNIVIEKERVELYEKIAQIDYLPNEEKLELHEILKKYNIIELFYDDMRMARDMVAETIKEYSLSRESILEYKDLKLSKEYGTDIYKINGIPFFGIVKTGRHIQDQYPTGHSYSLVGDKGLAIFGDVKKSNTFMYDSNILNKNQIVHTFPFDSYTLYRPFEYREEASRRVSVLMTPEQLTSQAESYNEILILEKGSEQTDIDEYIPELEKMALYCIDEISEQDVEVAKNNDVGIVLIDSTKYENNDKYNHIINGYYEREYNYFDGITDREKYEQRR